MGTRPAALRISTATNAGSAYVYRRTETGLWTQDQKLIASDAATGDLFGESVAAFADRVIVGAGSNDDNGASSGSTP